MTLYVLIFLASGLGGVLRHATGTAAQAWFGRDFPLGTLVVNVSGCLAMGFLITMFATTLAVHEEYRLAVLVGLLGGYTTFSSFGRDTIELVNNGQLGRAALYVLLSVSLSLIAVWGGSAIATRLNHAIG